MSGAATFPYVHLIPSIGAAGWMPMLPVSLELAGNKLQSLALVDTGSTVNVIPYQMGLQLGGNWNQFSSNLPMGGILSNHPAKPLFLDVSIAPFAPVHLTFAWSQSPLARLLLGQFNFFLEFDICFFRSQNTFQIQPRTP